MQVDVPDTTKAPQTEDINIDLEEEDNDSLVPSSTTANPMNALVESARARAQEYDSEQLHSDDESDEEGEMEDDAPSGVSIPSTSTQTNPSNNFDPSLRAHASTFHNVLSSASIILYVLDARDPLSTRSKSIERQIAAADGGSKRLILILNKIDLVPPEVLKEWLIYLRRFHPTLPLRASSSAPNAKTYDHKALTAKGTLEALLRALKATAQKLNAKGSTTVGILGYPNVGKSSVINGLTNLLSRKGGHNNHGSACPTGAEAGITTHVREVKIDNKVKILDAPGIIFPSDSYDENPSSSSSSTASTTLKHMSAATKANLALLSALPPKAISDPIPAITLLLSRFQALDLSLSSLLSTYHIPALSASTTTSTTSTGSSVSAAKDLTTPFLVEVARKRGRLGKGGVPNLNAAAMCVLGDWRDGRLMGGWMEPPKGGRSEEAMRGTSEEGAGEMDIDGDGDGGGGRGEEVLKGRRKCWR